MQRAKNIRSVNPSMLLQLADNLRIHPDLLLSNGNGIFASGSQGSGKSVTLKLLLEQIAQVANVPMSVFDREQDLVALVDLFPRGVLATFHNCPTARDILAGGLQVVYDLSSWPNFDVAGQAVARLVNQLMHEAELTPFQMRVPLVVGMDEAQYWLPQSRAGGSLDEETYRSLKNAFESVATRGRKHGLVPFLFAQTFGGINKDVLSPGTYILMKQNRHPERRRYLEYLLPVEEFKYFTDRQAMQRIGDLGQGEAIVKLANGEQKTVQFYHCQSDHVSHTPTAQAAINRYAGVSFNPEASYGAYIEDEAMEVVPDELVTTEPVATSAEKPLTAADRVRALLDAQPGLRVTDLAKLANCDSSIASKVRKAYFNLTFEKHAPAPLKVGEQEKAETPGVLPQKRRVKKSPVPVDNAQSALKQSIHMALDEDSYLAPSDLARRFGCDLETAKEHRMSFFNQINR
jgi:hypothetical protein